MSYQEEADSTQRPSSVSHSVDSDSHSATWADAPDHDEQVGTNEEHTAMMATPSAAQSSTVSSASLSEGNSTAPSGEAPTQPQISSDTANDDSGAISGEQSTLNSRNSLSSPATPSASAVTAPTAPSNEFQKSSLTPGPTALKVSNGSTGVAALMKRFESNTSPKTLPPSSRSTSAGKASSAAASSAETASDSILGEDDPRKRTSVLKGQGKAASLNLNAEESVASVATAHSVRVESRIVSDSTAPENTAPCLAPDHTPASSTPSWSEHLGQEVFTATTSGESSYLEDSDGVSPWATAPGGDLHTDIPAAETARSPVDRTHRRSMQGLRREGQQDQRDVTAEASNRFSTVSLSSTVPSLAQSEIAGARRRDTATLSKESALPVTPVVDAKEVSGTTAETYDFLLARLENENGRLSRDPKAARASIDGVDKLKDNFERLKDRVGHRRGESGTFERKASSTPKSPKRHPEEEEAINWPGEETDEDKIDWDFWGNVMNNYQEVARNQPQDLSKAIQAGIPATLRGMMWQLMSSSKDEEMEMIYSFYLKQSTPHEKAIRRDLSRTFPEQDYFQDGKGVGQDNLFNVVKAYSLYDEEVGYCQGMNFLVGPLLLNMPDEEAFSTLVRLMKSYDLRGHFTPNMPLLQLRLFQFDRLLEEFLPLLHKHLVRQGVKSSMYASQWFMTLFSYRFPLDFVYRILDSVFAEGIEAIFRFALALMAKSEDTLLELNFEDAVEFLKVKLVDVYLSREESVAANTPTAPSRSTTRKIYATNDFVRDAFAMRVTPFMLDGYAAEFDAQVKAANAHRREVDALRLVNRNLSARVQALEDQLNSLNTEHVELVRQVVEARIAKEEIAEEFIRYKYRHPERLS